MPEPARPFALSALVGMPEGDFFARHWEREPLHVRSSEPRRYAHLLTRGDIEQILASADLRFPAVQLARHGGYFPPEVYTRTVKHGTEVWNGVPDIEKIQAEYRTGATLVFPALHRTWEPLRKLCFDLEQALSHAVHANVYLTPGNTTGFQPHYDTHEVLVLQIDGRKRWRVWDPPLPLPHRSQPFSRGGHSLGEPRLELELAPGDLLYLPRGFVHGASTSSTHALHVTIGVTVYTWVELLSEWVQSSREDPRFREALPPGFAAADPPAGLDDALRARVELLRSGTHWGAIVEAMRGRVRAAQPRAPTPFRMEVRVIGPQTLLRPIDADRYEVGTDNGVTTLTFDGRTLRMPARVRPLLDAIRPLAAFALGDLPKQLDEQATLAFVQFLSAEGFLTEV